MRGDSVLVMSSSSGIIAGGGDSGWGDCDLEESILASLSASESVRGSVEAALELSMTSSLSSEKRVTALAEVWAGRGLA